MTTQKLPPEIVDFTSVPLERTDSDGTKWIEYDWVKRFIEQADKLADALEKITKSQYGAQGYVEEGDIEGLASYWAQIALSYQDIAREILVEWRKFRGLE